MKIKEFSIIKYGPLKSIGPIELSDNFTLLSGKNEVGKSLTVDALTKFLLKKKARSFNAIKRVEEQPEGYLNLEIEGKTNKLPEQGIISEVSELSASECRNIFIIRDSDLSIEEEENFLTEVTDKLTGLKANLITDLKDKIRDIIRITPTGKFKSTKEDNHLGDRVDEAENLIKKIDELVEKLKDREYEKIESKLINFKNKKEEIEDKLNRLEIAQKKQKYEKAEKSLSKIKKAEEKIKNLRIYKEEDWQKWRDNKKELERINKEIEELDSKLKENKDKREELRKKEKEIERERYSLSKKTGQTESFKVDSILSVVLTVINLIIWYLTSIRALLFSTLVLGAISLFIILKGIYRKPGQISKKKEKELAEKEKELEQVKEEKIKFEDRVKNLEKDIQKNKKTKEKKQKMIEKLKKEGKVEKLEDYKEKLEEKQKKEEIIKEAETILTNLFGGERLKEWQKRKKNLEEYKSKEPGIEYEESKVQKLKEDLDKTKKEINNKKEEVEKSKEDIREIERRSNQALDLKDDFYYCDTFSDLEGIKIKLKNFIEEHRKEKENAIKVIKILKKLEQEEKEKIAELFGKDSLASDYFKKITEEEYEKVTFNQDKGTIEVINKEGKTLEASKLSGGAYDQLFFSIRLALAEKLLDKEKGFFIMDDPFIKSDLKRLKTQLQILKDISFKLGWQILYFTAKGEELEEGTVGEIRSLLNEDIKKDKIKNIKIK